MATKKKKIKILVDGRWFEDYYSGVSTYLKGLYNSLSKYDSIEITVVGRDIDALRYNFPRNIEFIRSNSTSNIKYTFVDLPRIINKGNYDLEAILE